jgi:Icc-related predicted phosphoesterase
MHDRIKVPDGDVLVHCGDFTGNGSLLQMLNFGLWLQSLPHKHKVVIAGNHDAIAEKDPAIVRQKFKDYGVIYLCEDEVEIDGVKFFGSPYTPQFMNWHFMEKRGIDMGRHWNKIPEDVDVLVTHGPPFGIRDKTAMTVQGVGCYDLRGRVNFIKPKLHIFGHIHDAHGVEEHDGVKYINCSVLDDYYNVEFEPVVVEIDSGEEE